MLIIGSRTIKIFQKNISENCVRCGSVKSVEIHLFQKYLHFYWIPLFPYKKIASTHCTQCGHKIDKRQFNQRIKDKHQLLLRETTSPIWTYFGLIFFIILMSIGIYNQIQNTKKIKSYIEILAVEDVYEMKQGFRQYTLAKVVSISEEDVFIRYHTKNTSKRRHLKNLIKNDTVYRDSIFHIQKTELKNLLKTRKIINVHREK